MADEIRIEHIQVKDLLNFAERVIGNAQEGQFIPISMQRARAHANNPYADPDDVALLAAIDSDEEVVGYFGILPLHLREGDKFHKVHWFTTWNVSAKVRGRGVGTDLMKDALTLGLDYLIVGSIHARRVCQKFGFWERAPLHYYWLDPSGMSQGNPLVLLRRAYRKLLWLLRIRKGVAISSDLTDALTKRIAPLSRKLIAPSLRKLESRLAEGYHFQEVDQIQGDPAPSSSRPKVELHRGVDAVNWMLRYPWVVETGESPTEEMDYYFSDTRPFFRQLAVEVKSNSGKYLGFAVFSVSQKGDKTALKALDFRFTNPVHLRAVLALALRYMRQFAADTLEIPAEIVGYLSRWQRRLLLSPKTRIYQCLPKAEDSPLARLWPEIELHLFDGDMAFS